MVDDSKKERPGKMRLIDAAAYRLPIAAYVSLLHRVSGLLLFFLLPFIIWMFDRSISSEGSYRQFVAVFSRGTGGFPGWFFKLIVLSLIWAYLHHFLTGLRFLWMDTTHSVSKRQGRVSGLIALISSLALTAALGAKLFSYF
jgi:succinate dehydrogenase / fumarate reductase cytochrome b subunit